LDGVTRQERLPLHIGRGDMRWAGGPVKGQVRLGTMDRPAAASRRWRARVRRSGIGLTLGKFCPGVVADAVLRSGGISNAADPWGDVMKFIVEVDFPLEPFSTYVRQGTAGEKIGGVPALSSPRSSTSPTTAQDAAP